MLMGLMQEGGGDPAPLEEEHPASGSLFSCSNLSWANTVWGIITEDTEDEVAAADAADAAWSDSEDVVVEFFPVTSSVRDPAPG